MKMNKECPRNNVYNSSTTFIKTSLSRETISKLSIKHEMIHEIWKLGWFHCTIYALLVEIEIIVEFTAHTIEYVHHKQCIDRTVNAFFMNFE